MAPVSARWPISRVAQRKAPGVDRLLRENPVLVLSALQAPETVAALVAEWNPAVGGRAWGVDELVSGSLPGGTSADASDGTSEGAPDAARRPPATAPRLPAFTVPAFPVGTATTPAVVAISDAIRWHGPIRLTPMLRADAGLSTPGESASGGIAYVAEVRRNRVKIADSRHAGLLRSRYPHGLPAGAEAEAWHLVRGLARRLRGVACLPGGTPYLPHVERHPADDDCRVFSHEILPWIVLREILRPLAPELSREALPEGGGYVLRQRGVMEVSVRPADAGTDLPHAIRDRADEGWPHSVYEFRSLAEPSSPSSPSSIVPTAVPANAKPPVLNSASLIAEITGGVLLDAHGFPIPVGVPSGLPGGTGTAPGAPSGGSPRAPIRAQAARLV